jgi:hypothetical protein
LLVWTVAIDLRVRSVVAILGGSARSKDLLLLDVLLPMRCSAASIILNNNVTKAEIKELFKVSVRGEQFRTSNNAQP